MSCPVAHRMPPDTRRITKVDNVTTAQTHAGVSLDAPFARKTASCSDDDLSVHSQSPACVKLFVQFL